MDDRQIMENLLINEKGACDLYLHGAIESADPQVHTAFDSALKNALDMQHTIYDKMSAKGWYPSQQAPADQVSQVREKYAAQ